MKYFVLDLWDDLRAKRLWPVAGALLLAMIALPVVVLKPAKEPASSGVKPEARPAQATPAVAVVDETSRESSDLGAFGKKDPFRPPAATLTPSTSSSTASSASAAGASISPSVSTGSAPSSGSTPAAVGNSGGSGSTAGGGATATPPVGALPRRSYTYVVDLKFGREGHTRLRRGIPRLRVLPSELSPVAVFLGVSASGKHAVFLLNAAFEQRGQGTCRPSRATCSFLYLATDPAKNGHRIVDDKGITYVLRLEAIRRVTVREASRASRVRPRSRAGTKSRGGAKSRAGSFPVFADEQR